MCMFGSSSSPKTEEYKQSAQSQTPDNASVATAAARRTTDKVKAMTPTVLTSGLGDQSAGNTQTQKKTLLGA